MTNELKWFFGSCRKIDSRPSPAAKRMKILVSKGTTRPGEGSPEKINLRLGKLFIPSQGIGRYL